MTAQTGAEHAQAPLATFAGELRALRLACGNPSYARLRRLSPLLPPATVSDALSGKVTPRLELVLAFVDACLSAAAGRQLAVDPTLSDRNGWQRRWQLVRRAVDRGPVAGPVQPEADRPADVWGSPPVWQLPNPGPTLYGRADEIDWLDRALGRGDGPPAASISSPIAVLEGMGGVGKTALALCWGHRHRHDFPDGQLFADLGGFGPGPPVDPAQVLAGFVRALGAQPPAVPADTSGLAALFRSLSADRKLLVVLDNAADAEQVRPLLPAAPNTVVIVTSRVTLRGLTVRDDAQRALVGPLHPDAAVALLSARLTRMLPSWQLHRLAQACGNLPLALRLAASRLPDDLHGRETYDADLPVTAGSPPSDLRPQRMMSLLADRADPYSDLSVVLSWSLSRSTAAERRALLLVSHAPSRVVDDHAAAALIGLPAGPARQLLAALADQHLVERRAGGWQLHDLIRAWGRIECLRALGPVEEMEAQRRVLGYYLWTADAVDRALLPQRGRPVLVSSMPKPLSEPQILDEAAALAWGDRTLASLVEVMQAALAADEPACAAVLPHILLSYLNRRKPWTQWIAMCRVGLEAAEPLNDATMIANLHMALGIAHRETHELTSAVTHFTAAGDGFRVAGNHVGTAMALNNLATAYRQAGHPADACEALRDAAVQMEGSDDGYRRAIIWHNLAEAEVDLGDLPAAVGHAELAAAAELAAQDDLGAAMTRTTIGSIQALLGRTDLAEVEYAAAAAVQRTGGALLAYATTQHRWGRLLVGAGRHDEAASHLREAAAILSDLGDPAAADVADMLERVGGSGREHPVPAGRDVTG